MKRFLACLLTALLLLAPCALAEAPLTQAQIDGLSQTVAALYFSEGEDENAIAVSYLFHLANLWYAERAETFADITETDYDQYLPFGEDEIDQLLDVAYNGAFTTAELIPDNDVLIYNAHAFYIGLDEKREAQIVYEGETDGAHTFALTYTGGDGAPFTARFAVTLAASDKNPLGVAVDTWTMLE